MMIKLTLEHSTYMLNMAGEPQPATNWCDHYRRCYSKDVLTVSSHVMRLMPASHDSDIGYVEVL